MNKLDFIKALLPSHYEVTDHNGDGTAIRCESSIGIDEITNETYFDAILVILRNKYTDTFQEVFHSTCSDHLSFTIYFRK